MCKQFLANVPISYPLKALENLWFYGVFQGKMGSLVRNSLNLLGNSDICKTVMFAKPGIGSQYQYLYK